MICEEHEIPNCKYCALDKTLQEIQRLLDRAVDLANISTDIIAELEPLAPHVLRRYEAGLQLLGEVQVQFHGNAHELFSDMYPDTREE